MLQRHGKLQLYADVIPYKKQFDGSNDLPRGGASARDGDGYMSLDEYVQSWTNFTGQLDTDHVPRYFFMPQQAFEAASRPFVSWWEETLDCKVNLSSSYSQPYTLTYP